MSLSRTIFPPFANKVHILVGIITGSNNSVQEFDEFISKLPSDLVFKIVNATVKSDRGTLSMLMYAVAYLQPNITDRLLCLGADPNFTNEQGETVVNLWYMQRAIYTDYNLYMLSCIAKVLGNYNITVHMHEPHGTCCILNMVNKFKIPNLLIELYEIGITCNLIEYVLDDNTFFM